MVTVSWFVKSKRAQSDTDFETWNRGGVSPTLNAFDSGDSRATVVIAFYATGGGNDAPGFDVSPTVKVGSGLGIPSPPAVATVAPTLSASNNPSRSPQSAEVTAQVEAVHEATTVVRRLTPVECERLQGFPDDWTAGQADSHRYKQMGNAVTVNVAEYVGVLITEYETQLSQHG